MKILEYIEKSVAKAAGEGYVAEQGAIKKLEYEYLNYKPNEEPEDEPESQAGIEPLSEKTKAFKNVCVAAETFKNSFRKVLASLKAIKEGDSAVSNFQENVNQLIEDYEHFEHEIGVYEKTINDELNEPDIEKNLEKLLGAVINAKGVYSNPDLSTKDYEDKTVQTLLDWIRGDGKSVRNSTTGKLKWLNKGLFRCFVETTERFLNLKEVNISPINQIGDYILVKNRIIGIKRQYNWDYE